VKLDYPHKTKATTAIKMLGYDRCWYLTVLSLVLFNNISLFGEISIVNGQVSSNIQSNVQKDTKGTPRLGTIYQNGKGFIGSSSNNKMKTEGTNTLHFLRRRRKRDLSSIQCKICYGTIWPDVACYTNNYAFFGDYGYSIPDVYDDDTNVPYGSTNDICYYNTCCAYLKDDCCLSGPSTSKDNNIADTDNDFVSNTRDDDDDNNSSVGIALSASITLAVMIALIGWSITSSRKRLKTLDMTNDGSTEQQDQPQPQPQPHEIQEQRIEGSLPDTISTPIPESFADTNTTSVTNNEN
jgi:hypothetical protein